MNEKITIGKIINTRGIKGELKVKVHEYKENKFSRDITYYIEEKPNRYLPIEITASVYQKNFFYIRLKGYDNINDVEKFREKYICIDEEDLETLDKDTFYIRDLIGLRVLDENNNDLGNLKDIYTQYSNPVLDVNGKLIPMVKEFILEVNINEGYIKVNMEGFYEV